MERPFKQFRRFVLVDLDEDVSQSATETTGATETLGTLSNPDITETTLADKPAKDELIIDSFSQR